MNKEIYATLQITKKQIIFVVGKYLGNYFSVIYKNKIKGDWLDDNEVILNERSAELNVKKFIGEAESRLRINLKDIILILPTNSLQSRNTSDHVMITNPNKRVTPENINTLYNRASNIVFENNIKVVNIKPIDFTIDSIHKSLEPPIGKTANILNTNMIVYTINKDAYESHVNILKKINKNILHSVLDCYAILDQVASKDDYKTPLVIVNWNETHSSIAFYSKRILVTFKLLNFGVDQLVSDISKRLGIQNEIAKKYIFNLIDFGSEKFDNNLLFRKYDSNNKQTIVRNTKEIKNIIGQELNNQITKMNTLIDHEFKNKVNTYKIKYVGKMNKISGIENLISNKSYIKNNFEIYFSKVLGASELWTIASTGAIKYTRHQNEKLGILKTSEIENVIPRNFQQQLVKNGYPQMQVPMYPNQQVNSSQGFQQQMQRQQQLVNNNYINNQNRGYQNNVHPNYNGKLNNNR